MRRCVLAGLLVFVVLALAACAPGPNPVTGDPSPGRELAGFWLGLWHGIIAPVTFIVSLFDYSVRMYEAHNVGVAYDLGYLLGLIGFWSSGAALARRRR